MPVTPTAQLRADHAEWKARRLQRIDRLSTFLDRAIRMARLENDPAGWWSKHVVWAIYRLDLLAYRFPECDEPRATGPRNLADVTVIAA